MAYFGTDLQIANGNEKDLYDHVRLSYKKRLDKTLNIRKMTRL